VARSGDSRRELGGRQSRPPHAVAAKPPRAPRPFSPPGLRLGTRSGLSDGQVVRDGTPRSPRAARRLLTVLRTVRIEAFPAHGSRWSPTDSLRSSFEPALTPFAQTPFAAVTPRFARDRPFRACGRSSHHERPFRAKVNVPSRQHQARFRSRRPTADGHETGLCTGRSLRAGRRKTHSAHGSLRSPKDSLRSPFEPALTPFAQTPFASRSPYGRPRAVRLPSPASLRSAGRRAVLVVGPR